MFGFLFEYSGILAAVFAWGFVVLPLLLVKFNRKKYPISYTGTRPKIGYIFNFGLLSSAISQLFLIYWLKDRYAADISLGSTIFLIGVISLVFSAFITLKTYKLHTTFASGYFALTAVGGFLIGLSLFNFNPFLAIFVSAFALVNLGSMTYFYFLKKNHALCEYASITFSTLWVLSFYLIR